jgi:hypothetical protein
MPAPIKSSSAAAAKKSPTKEAVAVPAAKAAAQPAKAAAQPAKAAPTAAERMKMIAEAAYYLAEKRGFGHGKDLVDWAAAEKQVDALIAKRG